MKLGGDPTVMVRVPSLVLGTATIPLVFLVALQFVHGALVGGAIGAGFGAAAPGLETECSFATRFGRSLLGSAAGASIGFLFRGDSKLLAVPILSVTGASLAEWRC